MTKSVSLANMPGPTADVTIPRITQGELRFRANELKGNQFTAEYVLANGDPTTETTVLVTTSADTKSNTLRTSISLRTVQTVTVDSVVTEVAPVVVSLTWTTPGASEDTSKLMEMIGACYGLVFHDITAKAPTLSTLDSLNRGIVNGLYYY
jgi:hypothetical protein